MKTENDEKENMGTITESTFPLIKNYSNPYRPKVYFIENPKG
ncbi:MAG: hypothetical protein ACJA1B_002472, partial [Polaribacter sp.]